MAAPLVKGPGSTRRHSPRRPGGPYLTSNLTLTTAVISFS